MGYEWGMRFERVGYRLVIMKDCPGPAPAVAQKIREAKVTGVIDAVPCFDCVGIYLGVYEPRGKHPSEEIAALDWSDLPASFEGRHFRVPVVYDGEDLEGVASRLGLGVPEVIKFHQESQFLCEAVGFCPGFGYLTGLHPALTGLFRLDSPRPRVAPGSVAIMGDQSAVYPMERPGGWWLIGRTPLEFVNVEERFFPLEVGDTVEFFAVSEAEAREFEGRRLEAVR